MSVKVNTNKIYIYLLFTHLFTFQVTLPEFVNWGSKDGCVLEELLKVIFQICHIVFGLRPQCRMDERDIIR